MRLSFPAFPGDLFRDGCDHPPRSQTGYPRCSTGSVLLRGLEDVAFRQRFDFIFIQVSAEDAERFLPDIDCRIFVPVHGGAALRTYISPVRQCQFPVDMPAGAAGLRGREPPVYPYEECATLPAGLFQIQEEIPPAVIGNRFPNRRDRRMAAMSRSSTPMMS